MSPHGLLVMLLALGALVHGKPAVSFTIPASILDGEMQKILPDILKRMEAITIPPNCCYGGPDNIHAKFENNQLVKSAFHLSGSLTSSLAGVKVEVAAVIKAQSSYDVCIKIFGCSTVEGCHGTGISQISIDGSYAISGGVTSAGRLNLTARNPVVNAAETQNSFCGKIAGGISGALRGNEGKIGQLMVEKSEALFTEVAAKLQQFESKLATLDLSFVRASTDAMGLTADAGVTVMRDGSRYPVTPTRGLPSAAPYASGDRFAIVVSEGLLGTLGEIAYGGGLLKGEVNSTILNQNLTIDWQATGPPTITIDPSANPVTLTATVAMRMTTATGQLVYTPRMTIVVGGVVSYNDSQKGFVLQVAFQNATFVNATAPLQQAIVAQIRTAIPGINSALAGMVVPLPAPKEATLSSPQLSFGPGFVVLTAALDLNITLPATKPLVLKCPDIDRFHHDGC